MATVYLAAGPQARPQGRASRCSSRSSPRCSAPSGSCVEIKTTAALQHPHILPLFDSRHGRRVPLLRHALHRGRDDPREAGPRDAVRRRRSGAHRARSRRRARLRASPRRDPPRHQAREHPAARRPADGDGLRHRARRERGRRRADDGDRALSLGTPHYMSPGAGDGGEGDHGAVATSIRWRPCCTRCWPASRRTSAARRSRSS